MKQDAERVLKEFLLDIDCLNRLSQWTDKVNFFEILKISRAEIRHSNMLAWLLDPNENHGLGDKILKSVILYAADALDKNYGVDTLMMDYYDFSVMREWHNIDLLAISHKNKFVLCIENKIDTGEHSNQLRCYEQDIQKIYSGYQKCYILLSKEGVKASEDNWRPMSYKQIAEIIEKAKEQSNLSGDANWIIENYVDTIRRYVLKDEKLAQICNDIYLKHKQALDLIFEYKQDKALELSRIFVKWAKQKAEKEEITFDEKNSNKTYTRFKTKVMTDILPDSPNAQSAWKTSNYYFWEIYNQQGERFHIQLSLSLENCPDELRKKFDFIGEFEFAENYRGKGTREGSRWRTPFKAELHFETGEMSSEENNIVDFEQRIFSELDARLEEVKAFEKKLKLKFEQEYKKGL